MRSGIYVVDGNYQDHRMFSERALPHPLVQRKRRQGDEFASINGLALANPAGPFFIPWFVHASAWQGNSLKAEFR